MTEIERGKHYQAGDFGAEWQDADDGGGWFVMRLSTGNMVGDYSTADALLHDLPEFADAKEIA